SPHFLLFLSSREVVVNFLLLNGSFFFFSSTFRFTSFSHHTMDQLLRGLLSQMAGAASANARPKDDPHYPDTAETVKISALALLKMLKHARSGVPLEVMGLMLGEFVDDFTISVVDVFAMPQSGTSVSVESVDPAYQAKMLEMLGRTSRKEMVVGWYHSHPGFGCWLSSVDQQTQQSFETLHKRAVAVVVDPIQSVKGKVVLEAFRNVQMGQLMNFSTFNPIRQHTSCIGHQSTASAVAIIHGLGKKYYSLVCEYNITQREQGMLGKLHAKSWMDGFRLESQKTFDGASVDSLVQMTKMANNYHKDLQEEATMTDEEKAKNKKIKNFGKLNSKQRLEQVAERTMQDNIVKQLCAASCFQAMRRADLKKEDLKNPLKSGVRVESKKKDAKSTEKSKDSNRSSSSSVSSTASETAKRKKAKTEVKTAYKSVKKEPSRAPTKSIKNLKLEKSKSKGEKR
ncbi:hypothetical protein PFISCL1PPCAC_8189, partial [Pristionchus fissidentatus]